MTDAKILEPAPTRLLSPGLHFTAVLQPQSIEAMPPFDLVQFSLDPGAGSEPGAMEISEIWRVVAGAGLLTIGETTLTVLAGDFVFIPAGAVHAILNTGGEAFSAISVAWPPPGQG